jgi:hypothetical protein
MKRGILLFSGILFIFASCSLDLSMRFFPESVGEADFYAYDYTRKEFYSVDARLLAENSRVMVYAEASSSLTPEDALEIAAEYSDVIQPRMEALFGDFSRYTGDEKLSLFFLDIRDGYSGTGDTYVSGFFNPADLYPRGQQNPYSNRSSMIYLDTNPGLRSSSGLEVIYATIAHELQHLINFSSRNDLGQSISNMVQQDIWIDEGLSMMAEDICRGTTSQTRIEYYNSSPYFSGSRIAQGNNFFIWDQSSYDEYATAYLFFRYLQIHSGNGGVALLQDIARSSALDKKAVTAAVKKHIPELFKEFDVADSDDAEWIELLRTWHLANLMNQKSGFYGYAGQCKISTPWYNGSSTSSRLAPGEAVYSGSAPGVSFSGLPPDSGGVIRNSGNPAYPAGVDSDPSSHIQYSLAPGLLSLLTFNVNPNNQVSLLETGYVATYRPAGSASQSRAAGGGKALPIDLRPPIR